jgi:hypothetical protein
MNPETSGITAKVGRGSYSIKIAIKSGTGRPRSCTERRREGRGIVPYGRGGTGWRGELGGPRQTNVILEVSARESNGSTSPSRETRLAIV